MVRYKRRCLKFVRRGKIAPSNSPTLFPKAAKKLLLRALRVHHIIVSASRYQPQESLLALFCSLRRVIDG